VAGRPGEPAAAGRADLRERAVSKARGRALRESERRLVWIHHSAGVARRDASGRAVATYGVLRDITERRTREETLRQSLAEIERLKDRLQAVLACSFLAKRIEVAKLYHFDSDRDRLFRRRLGPCRSEERTRENG
jgi:PAS domain-containing protein